MDAVVFRRHYVNIKLIIHIDLGGQQILTLSGGNCKPQCRVTEFMKAFKSANLELSIWFSLAAPYGNKWSSPDLTAQSAC